MKSETNSKIPRGIRNNNPLNIRVGNKWQGEVDVKTDKDFEQFIDVKYGIRAAILILYRYVFKSGLHTIRDILRRWAPPVENNTKAYEQSVRYFIGKLMEPNKDIPYYGDIEWRRSDIFYLLYGMCKVESNYTLKWDTFKEAWELAEKTNPKIYEHLPQSEQDWLKRERKKSCFPYCVDLKR